MKNKDGIQQDTIPPQNADAALLLSQAIEQLTDTSMKKCLQNMPEQIMQLSHQTHQIETKQQQFLYHLESIKKYLEKLLSNNKLLENAGNTNQLLSNQHYEDCIIEPMTRSLFAVIDLIKDFQKSLQGENQGETDQGKLLKAVEAQLLQFFVNYGIEIIQHQPNSTFYPKVMKPVTRISTSDKELDGRIAESLQSGFIWKKQKVLRSESVSLYKYECVNINPIEKGELS